MDIEPSTEIEQLSWAAIPAQLKDGLAQHPLSRRQLKHWTLVLQARQIPCRVETTDNRRQLLVPVEYYQQALVELIHFERENHNWPPPPPADTPLKDNQTATLWVMAALILFHNLASHNLNLPGARNIDWLALGNAHAGQILEGQWWRVITALTLHSGTIHLLGNVTIGGFLMLRLCRMFGSGFAFFLVLSAGAMGNTFNALLQSSDHRSIGSSTAVFAALGLLATYNMLRFRLSLWHRWPVPLAAAVGLLAMLGAGGENTDIGAHLFGFLCGIGWAGLSVFRPDGFVVTEKTNRIWGFIAVVLVTGAWWLATVY